LFDLLSDNIMNKANPDNSKLTEPQLYLSSEDCSWDYIELNAYHEPDRISNWIEPVVPEVTLVMLTRGKMVMEQEHAHGIKHQSAVHQGDMFLKPGGSKTKPLNWKTLSNVSMETVHLHLNSSLLQRTLTELADKDGTYLALARHSGLRDPMLSQISISLYQSLIMPSGMDKLYADSAAQLLCVHLLRHYAIESIPIPERKDGLSRKQFIRIKDFIDANAGTNISLDELAGLVGFSPYHFVRLFRDASGYTPYQFVTLRRIERAKHLLKNTDMPLAEIAIATGFTHQSHFTQVFKRHLGITPLEFRKQ